MRCCLPNARLAVPPVAFEPVANATAARAPVPPFVVLACEAYDGPVNVFLVYVRDEAYFRPLLHADRGSGPDGRIRVMAFPRNGPAG
jgi:hypothetical protein